MEGAMLYRLLLFLSLVSFACCSCDPSDRALLALAFRFVSGFQIPAPATDRLYCSSLRELRLPSRNLTGTVSWMPLRKISTLRILDLSGNALQGSIPGRFWANASLVDVKLAGNRLGGAFRFDPACTSSSIRSLNLSGNRFTSAVGLDGFRKLEVLDLSRNRLAIVPVGLEALTGLKYLDLSCNAMSGVFPEGFPPMVRASRLAYVNFSYNNFTGVVEPELAKKFGRSAFIKAGYLSFSASAPTAASSPSPTYLISIVKKQRPNSRKRRVPKVAVIAAAAIAIVLLVFCGGVRFAILRQRRKKGRNNERKRDEKEALELAKEAEEQEVRWVVEARSSAPVVMFEKPLMQLTFRDLVKATSAFGKESQLAEGGRSGPLYRAVLPGDIDVVVRVVQSAMEAEEKVAAAAFRELARFRHPNLLPLLGYCIPGKEKLALYEYVERGDLHRWLHELPAGHPDLDDCSGETWEQQHSCEGAEGRPRAADVGDWPTRHRIALGAARGLAFLHQGWAGSPRGGVAHGHLIATNVLLDDDLEPRVADFGGIAGEGTVEGDVYDYGVMVLELMTGRQEWSEVEVGWAREMVKTRKAIKALDPRLLFVDPEEEKEAAECLRVGYLCTAPSPEKRPTMQQVVGLLKDIRPSATTAAAAGSIFTDSSTT